MKLIIFLTLFNLTWQFDQLLPTELTSLKDNSPVVKKLEGIIKDSETKTKNSITLRSNKSPEFEHSTPEDVEKYQLNSMLAGCGGLPGDTMLCICPSTYEKTEVIENSAYGSLAVVTINKKYKQILVSYRATSVGQNWLTDLNFPLTKPDFSDKAKVHQGFYDYYKTLRPGTIDAAKVLLDQPEYSNYTLQITGYSMGAAISLMAAINWVNLLRERNDKRKIEIYAYSGPRVGDEAFVDHLASLNVPITRFSSQNDFVPHLPPRSFGYVHAGAELYFDPNEKKVRVCSQDYYEDPTCSQSNENLSLMPHLFPFGKLERPIPICMFEKFFKF